MFFLVKLKCMLPTLAKLHTSRPVFLVDSGAAYRIYCSSDRYPYACTGTIKINNNYAVWEHNNILIAWFWNEDRRKSGTSCTNRVWCWFIFSKHWPLERADRLSGFGWWFYHSNVSEQSLHIFLVQLDFTLHVVGWLKISMVISCSSSLPVHVPAFCCSLRDFSVC